MSRCRHVWRFASGRMIGRVTGATLVSLGLSVAVCPTAAHPKALAGGWAEPLSPMPGVSARFLANDCGRPGYGPYLRGLYHTGTDLARPAGTPVRAVGPGNVTFAGSFGPGNGDVVFVQHRAGNGEPFQAMYGHVNIVRRAGDRVSAGERIATVFPLASGPHLHLGLVPGTNRPGSGWGMQPCRLWPFTNGFVDALRWLATHPAKKAPDPNPRGRFEKASSPGAGRIVVRGWAFDPSLKTRSLRIHVKVGGRVGTPGIESASLVADKARPDVARAYPGIGARHGFNTTIKTKKSGLQAVCAYAVNVGPGTATFLGCKPVAIAGAAAPEGTPPPPRPPLRRVVTVDNRVTNGATQMREDPIPVRLTTKPWIRCGARGCNIAGTERRSGQSYDAAVCQTTGERTTNGQDGSPVDDANPGLFTSTRYYGVRLSDGRFGYVSEVWLARASRGGLALPRC